MKIILLFLISLSFLSADIYTDIKNNPKKIIDLLKDISREERKEICFKIMIENEFKNPKLSYTAANCLLYNGYGKDAIPIFTRYIYFDHYNERFFNGRIGYGWFHSADWYHVGKDVLSKMTNGKNIYEWVTEEINKEIHSNYKKYGLSLSDIFQLNLKSFQKESHFSKKEELILNNCSKLYINIDNISCIFHQQQFKKCKKTNNKKFNFKCLEK